MSSQNHSERYWEILQHNIEWLRFSETKATVILTVYGIILTIAYTNSHDIFQGMSTNWLLLVLIFLYAAASIMSILFAFLAINPSLKNTNGKSILYFRHIREQFDTLAKYKFYADGIVSDDDKFSAQLVEQIYVIADIAVKKFVKVTWALRCFFFSLGVLLITILVYVIQEISKK